MKDLINMLYIILFPLPIALCLKILEKEYPGVMNQLFHFHFLFHLNFLCLISELNLNFV